METTNDGTSAEASPEFRIIDRVVAGGVLAGLLLLVWVNLDVIAGGALSRFATRGAAAPESAE